MYDSNNCNSFYIIFTPLCSFLGGNGCSFPLITYLQHTFSLVVFLCWWLLWFSDCDIGFMYLKVIPDFSKNTSLENETNIYLFDFMRKESNMWGKESLWPPLWMNIRYADGVVHAMFRHFGEGQGFAAFRSKARLRDHPPFGCFWHHP